MPVNMAESWGLPATIRAGSDFCPLLLLLSCGTALGVDNANPKPLVLGRACFFAALLGKPYFPILKP